jgi:histidinol-phosphate aminotransferase
MPVSRRSFLNAFELGGSPGRLSAVFVAARGREALEAEGAAAAVMPPADPMEIRIDSNENPTGPGAAVIAALTGAFGGAGRYPTNTKPSTSDLRDAVARKLNVRPENLVLGAGSRELLRNAVRFFTSGARHLITASPSYEQPERIAEQIGTPVKRVALDKNGRLDLEKMAEVARWGGLVYLCNPNNPTATVLGAKAVSDFVARLRKESPETAILIDEAYHDYVTEPAYATALPLALEHPNVLVARTLSKAHGMAGLRVGYAVGQVRTIEAMGRWSMPYNQSVPGIAAAIASLGDQAHIDAERARNTEVRKATARFFADAGLKMFDSQGNFVFVETKRPAKEFKEACAKEKVLVGRPFPPLDQNHARISLGTMEEMTRAFDVFARVLGTYAKGISATSPSNREK